MFRLRCAALCAALMLAPVPGYAQARLHVTGPFVHFGGVAGSVTHDQGSVDNAHSGGGWGAGAGYNLKPWLGLLGNYSIFTVKDEAANKYNFEQSEAGVRLRLSNGQTPVVFYVEGGGALRRATLSATEVFGVTPPADADDRIAVDGWAGWAGPGVQLYVFGPRIPIDAAVGWAWGNLTRAHVGGNTVTLDDPIAVTTLRLRLGISAAIF